MITIENQNAIATFSPVSGASYLSKMYFKETQEWVDLGYTRAKHIPLVERAFSASQLENHPILKEWGC
jgi:hypothetical protein